MAVQSFVCHFKAMTAEKSQKDSKSVPIGQAVSFVNLHSMPWYSCPLSLEFAVKLKFVKEAFEPPHKQQQQKMKNDDARSKMYKQNNEFFCGKWNLTVTIPAGKWKL